MLRSSGMSLQICIHFAQRDIQDTSDIFNGHLGFHSAEGDNLRDIILAIFVEGIIDDLAAPRHADVNVDIGVREPLRIDKSLKEELKAKRLDIGDPDQIAGRSIRPPIPVRALPESPVPWPS